MWLLDLFKKTNEEELNKAIAPKTKTPPVPEAVQVSPIDVANAFLIDGGAIAAEANRGLDYDQLRDMSRVDFIAAILQIVQLLRYYRST